MHGWNIIPVDSDCSPAEYHEKQTRQKMSDEMALFYSITHNLYPENNIPQYITFNQPTASEQIAYAIAG
jgi:hypothetical protein